MKVDFPVKCMYCPNYIQPQEDAQQIPAPSRKEKDTSPFERMSHKTCARQNGPNWVKDKLKKEIG